jgi:hypothetical protein
MQKITGDIAISADGIMGMWLSTVAITNGALCPHTSSVGMKAFNAGIAIDGGRGISLDTSKSPGARTGYENAPVWLAVLFLISY